MTQGLMATALTIALLAVGGLASAASPSGDGQDRRVRVHNQTGLALQSLQAAAVGTGMFGADLLGGAQIPTGVSRPVLLDNGDNTCRFDLKAGLADGQTVVRESINACRISDYYLTL
jgi:hypothetical protein